MSPAEAWRRAGGPTGVRPTWQGASGLVEVRAVLVRTFGSPSRVRAAVSTTRRRVTLPPEELVELAAWVRATFGE